MTIREIRLLGDPVLRTPGAEVTTFDEGLATLVNDMMETMRAAGGVGLAAPQIGISQRVLTYEVDDQAGHVINPVIIHRAGEQLGTEGCLSIPGVYGDVPRAYDVVVQGVDVTGQPVELTVDDYLARCLQHEIDHLDGVLFLERLDPDERRLAMKGVRSSSWFQSGAKSWLPTGEGPSERDAEGAA